LILRVNPEGRVIHQTLGVFDLSNSTLSDAREKLMPVLTRMYAADSIVVGVDEPRRTAVMISGTVEQPGMYKAYTSQRVSELIEQAGGVAYGGSRRWIVMTGGPETLGVDLDRSLWLGDNDANPCVYAGYAIHVPDRAEARVQIVGEVNQPREVELRPGDDLSGLLALAGGIRSGASLQDVVIIRGRKKLPAGGIDIQSGDIVFVPPSSGERTDRSVVVFGAVDSPGRYDSDASPTLLTMVEQAGGLLAEANPALITVFRRAAADAWGRSSERRYPITSAIGGSDDLMQMELQPDDSIYVPYAVGYVEVSGEVLNPGLFPFVPDRDVEDYIEMAGGMLPTAEKERIDRYNPIARITSTVSRGTRVRDGDQLIVNRREELQ
jgi:protein involved in polysaccharide export with SLBB domain